MNSKNDSTPSAGVSRPLYSQVLASPPPIRRVDVPRIDPQATNTRQQSLPVAYMNPAIRMVTPRAPAVASVSSVPVSAPPSIVNVGATTSAVIYSPIFGPHQSSSLPNVCSKCPKTFKRRDVLTKQNGYTQQTCQASSASYLSFRYQAPPSRVGV
ncbi:hypothetical protein JTE90_007341 [Oedothorax gibbosus]|uniref:Uncharacterized protein n=1 Tax=Oedothorax gibbosus TaxID=931172 RepID=A0AAV6TS17_9ARAC|nr:hypothetical protein JTE90_007341 [Oedothorax gibbosus]